MSTRSRPSSARPAPSKRGSVSSSRGTQRDSEIMYECKAAYLVVFEDVDEKIESRRQFCEVLQQAGRNLTRKKVDKYWTEDTDSLSFDEFVDVCVKEPATSQEDLIKAFRKIDLNGDGYIDNHELKKVLTTRGEKMTTAEVQAIIDEVDENDDGKLDYKEFSKMLLSTQKECQKLAMEAMEKKVKSSKSSRSSNRRDEDRDTDATLEEDRPRNGRDVSEEPDTTEEVPEEPNNKPTITSTSDPEDSDDDDVVVGSKSTRSSLSVPSKKERFGSNTSLRTSTLHTVSLTNMGSTSSLSSPSQQTKRAGSLTSLASLRSNKSENAGRPSPRAKERSKSPLVGKDLTLPKPKRLKDWKLAHSKGCFFFDDDNVIISHQYELVLPKDTSVWITIEPFSIRPGGDLNSAREVSRSPIDTMLYILRGNDSLVTMTEQRDTKGRYGVRCDLERGRYKLIPFSTGCRFRPRTSEPSSETRLVKKSDDKYILTKPFKEALNDIFELCDLDGNGHLSREEFNFFNIRTSGEEVNDTEWEVVEDRLELKNGEITRQGFIQLNQMEADDNEGDTEELWVTLESMGFNKSLSLDEACPFFMEIYTESCEAKLQVTDLEPGGLAVQQAIVDATMGKGEASKIRNMKDLYLHTYQNDYRACLVVENKSHHSVKVNIDNSRSDNCTPNTPKLDHTITVPSRTSVVAQHLMPTKETKEWTLRCQENVIK